MTDAQQEAVRALMTLYPPHPKGYGKLNGFKPGSTEKNQWTEDKRATEAEYLYHLTAKQKTPHGIGQYAKQDNLAFWLCFDMDQHKEGFEEAATLVYEALIMRGFLVYWETTTSGGIHLWVFTPTGGVSCETVVQVGKVITAEVQRSEPSAPIEIYPASFETSAVFGGKYVNLPYRGALLDDEELGATYLVWEGAAVPLSELAEIDRTPLEVWQRAAQDYEAPPAYDGPIELNPAPEVWVTVKDAVSGWQPTARHEAMLAVAGAGFRTGTNASDVQTFLESVSSKWFGAEAKRRAVGPEIKRAVEATFTKGTQGHPVSGIATLRRMGCPIPKFKPPEPNINILPSISTSFQGLKKELKTYPADPEAALIRALESGLWARMAQLPRAEQSVLIQTLRRSSGIGIGEAKSNIREAEDADPTPNDLRDLVLENWDTTGVHVRYVAEWEAWYLYGNGVYKLTLEASIKQRIEHVLEAQGHKLRESVLNDVIAKISRSPNVYLEEAPPPAPFLNLKNGLLNINTLALTPHTPEVLSMAQSNTYYDPAATCPKFNAFITRVCPDETNRETLQEFLGYVLSEQSHLQKALYLKGDAGTGKGTLTTTVINALLGGSGKNGLVATMALKALEDDNHSLVGALNKRLIIVSEVSRNDDLLGFKKITGGDPMHINPKNKTPFNARIDAKVIITANENVFTGVDNANGSIDRRLIILPFNVPQRPEDRNPNIGAELTTPEELSGVLNWCLDGWHRLKANGYKFTSDGDETQRLEFLSDSNHVIDFLRDWCEPEPESEIGSTDLYEHWKDWCLGPEVDVGGGLNRNLRRTGKGSGHVPGSQKSFASKLEAGARVLGWTLEKSRSSNRKNRLVVWKGIKVDPQN